MTVVWTGQLVLLLYKGCTGFHLDSVEYQTYAYAYCLQLENLELGEGKAEKSLKLRRMTITKNFFDHSAFHLQLRIAILYRSDDLSPEGYPRAAFFLDLRDPVGRLG